MPGSANCARCGAMLSLASMAIDVHPPRATALGKSMVGLWRFRRLGLHFWNFLPKEIRWPRVYRDAANMELPTVLRCLVPGWANIHVGQRGIGWAYLAAYLTSAVLGFALMGSPFGAILLGGAFALHIASAVTALAPSFDSFAHRLIFTGICGFLLTLFLYIPIGSVFLRLAVPLVINAQLSPFNAGDLIWYRPTHHVEPGQYALYNSRDINLNNRHIVAGLRLNRVIATAGQTLTLEQGKWYIDGELSPVQLPDELKPLANYQVPANSVLLDPENLVGANYLQWQAFSLVPTNRLVGVVFLQSWPLSRFEFY